MAAATHRILIVRTDRLGDVLLTLPLLPVLRNSFPDARLFMLLREYTGAIVEGNRFLDGIVWYDEGGRIIPFPRMLRRLREKRSDAVVVVHPTLRLALLMAALPGLSEPSRTTLASLTTDRWQAVRTEAERVIDATERAELRDADLAVVQLHVKNS